MSRQVEAAALDKTIPSNEVISAVRYALILGSVLTVANKFDVILRGSIHASLLVKICLNFVIPFAVSSVSAYANRCGP